MDVRAEFQTRMLMAAKQFKRELEAAGAADGVVEPVVNATNTGVEIIFFAKGATPAPLDPGALPLIGRDGHLIEDDKG